MSCPGCTHECQHRYQEEAPCAYALTAQPQHAEPPHNFEDGGSECHRRCLTSME